MLFSPSRNHQHYPLGHQMSHIATFSEFNVSDIKCSVRETGEDVYSIEFKATVGTTSSERAKGIETRETVIHKAKIRASSIEGACQVATALAERLARASSLDRKQSRNEGTSFRVTGKIKWWNDNKGYGFIVPDSGADDVFLHHSSLLMEGFKTVVEGDPVSFEIGLAKLGTSGEQVVRLDHPEDDPSLSNTEFHAESIALALVDGSIRLLAVAPDGRWRLVDEYERQHSFLYVWSLDSAAFHAAVQELEELINDPHVREQDLHDFFEQNPDFILTDDYQRAHSKIVLESDSDDTLIPDFVLEPVGNNALCDLLELKLPQVGVDVTKPRRARFSAAVVEACAQLRKYRDYFEEKQNREYFKNKYRLLAFRPRMFVIIGRRGRVDPIELRRIEGDLPAYQIRTYDDILERAKHKLTRFRTQWRRN